jgi:hypothetical protein
MIEKMGEGVSFCSFYTILALIRGVRNLAKRNRVLTYFKNKHNSVFLLLFFFARNKYRAWQYIKMDKNMERPNFLYSW